MSPSLANFLFEAANFVLLAVALGWLLFKPVRRALDQEREQHEQQAQEAARLHEEAEALAEQARQARRDADQALDEQREEVLAAAREQADALLEETRERQRAERRALEQELAGMREAELQTMADAVGRLAARSVRALLDEVSGPSLDEALVGAACRQLRALPADARRRAVVESVRALTPSARTQLEQTLGGPFELRVVDELGAGVRVTTPAGQVDATATALARRASQLVAGQPPEQRAV